MFGHIGFGSWARGGEFFSLMGRGFLRERDQKAVFSDMAELLTVRTGRRQP